MGDKTLTARFVETVKDAGKYHDGGGAGLYLRVTKAGSKQWVQRLTIHGKRRELGLGSPPTISLAMARRLATQNKEEAVLGSDPLAQKQAARKVLLFADAVDVYLAAKLSEFKNEKHKKQWRSTLNNYANPVLGRMSVADIAVHDVLRVLEPIWHTKTETASRLRGRIENVLSWATVAGHRTGDNPACWKGNLSEMLPKPSKVAKSENQPAVSLKDVARWWVDLSGREGMGARALAFAALTGARSIEVRGMTWDELDGYAAANSANLANRKGVTWALPASRMKNEKPHRVPLPAAALEILRDLPRLEGSPYVFFAPRGGMLSDMALSGVMRRMHEAQVKAGGTGYLDPTSKRRAVPHGLRSTFRQWAAEQGYPRDMAEIALSHLVGSEVERAYQRSDMLERRRSMMAAWSSFLRGENESGSAENVISLPI